MSNSIQTSQTTQDEGIDYKDLARAGVEEGTIDMDFSLPDLDCTDPDFLCFDPFPFHSTNDEIFPLPSSVVPAGVIDPSLITENSPFECSGELNAIHGKLQKRIDQLDETCKRLENEFYYMQSRVWSVETYLRQLGAWYFNFKAVVNKNTAMLSGKMESLIMGTSFG